MADRVYCDACDRDITNEPHARVMVGMSGSVLSGGVKPRIWDWCEACAQSRGIEFEKYNEDAANG